MKTLASLFACTSALVLTVHAALSPEGLTCEYTIDPLGVDVASPRLFWKLQSDERGQRQSAYQILVASSTSLLAQDQGDLWDSGKVASDNSIQIAYSGKPLKSSQIVFWKVRAWDRDDKASPWSSTARWTMGLVPTNNASAARDSGPTEWQAKWICAPAATETLLLRHEFDVKPRLVRAVVHVSGLGHYEMTLNGSKAGTDLLSPGWTDYNDTVLYDTKDVTELIHEGRNAIGLCLGNGMYNVVRRNRFVKFTGSFGALRAICELHLEYADGSKQVVGTDDSWRTSPSPIIFSNIYGGEDFDARLAAKGWDKPKFDDSQWHPAVLLVRPPGTLRGLSVAAPPLSAIEIHKPVFVRPLTNGEVLFDLGQNASHMPRIRVTGPVGSVVRLIPSEITNTDGMITQSTMGAGRRGSSWWEYTKGTSGEETWSPSFCYIGCRYIQARLTPAKPGGKLPQIKSLEGIVVHSTAAPAGDFECSNDLLNRTRVLVRWAQRANMVSVLTDCPHREKLGWLEQYHLNGPSIRYEFDVPRIFTKGMNDMADSQLRNGLIPNIAPEYTVFDGTFRAAAEWGAAFIIVPWQQYEFDADVLLLGRHYPAMKRYFAYLESISTNDIVPEGLGDWYDIVPNQRPGAARLTPPPVTASAFYFYDAWILSRMAEILGHADEAHDYAERAERIRNNYNRAFFHADTGSYATGSQCANALPLVLGIVDSDQRDRVLASLIADLESRDYAITAGDVGFRFLLQALAEGGRSDIVYRIVNRDDIPGYGYQLKRGATSLTEAWDANNSSSHNHFMLGQITEWFYKDLCGIKSDPTGPGFKKILIRPQPVGDMTWARASYNSVRGKISSAWKRDGDAFSLAVNIPANTSATVFVPAGSADQVTESGKAATQSVGVRFVSQEKDRAIFAIESGSYEFKSHFSGSSPK